jgi:hypothetical protein
VVVEQAVVQISTMAQEAVVQAVIVVQFLESLLGTELQQKHP